MACNECCVKAARWLLFAFNVIACFIGIGLIACGAYAYTVLTEYVHFFENININAPALVLIAFGCVTFIIAAVGCLGAFKQSSCLLFAFAAIIATLLIAELSAGAVAFVFRGTIEIYVKENAVILMKTYNETRDDYVKAAWDELQTELECCGVSNASEWQNLALAPMMNGTIPLSCKDHKMGCVDTFIEFVYSNIILIGAAGVGFALLEITGVVLACIVGCNAKKEDI